MIMLLHTALSITFFFSYSYQTMSPSSVKLGIIFSQSWMSISRSLLFITLFFSFFFFFCLYHRLDLCACGHIHAHIKCTSKTWLSLCSYWRWGWWFSFLFFNLIYIFIRGFGLIKDNWLLGSCFGGVHHHMTLFMCTYLYTLDFMAQSHGHHLLHEGLVNTCGLWSCGTCSHFPASTFLHQVDRPTCDMIVQLAFVYVLSNLYLE